jgi:hypothetical protein
LTYIKDIRPIVRHYSNPRRVIRKRPVFGVKRRGQGRAILLVTGGNPHAAIVGAEV